MGKINKEKIIALGETARIAITEAEAAQYKQYFEEKLSAAAQLLAVNTEGVKRTSHGIELINVMRSDLPSHGLTEVEVFKNAPAESEAGHFRVPTILE